MDLDRALEKLAARDGRLLVGTLPCMAPEQVGADPRDVDTRADVYALGVVLYELLSGQLPRDLEHCTLPVALRRIGDEPAPRLSSADARFRGDLDTILAMALEIDRERRYASPGERGSDLARFLADEPTRARPSSTDALDRLRTLHSVYFAREDFERAAALLEESVVIARALHGDLYPTFAYELGNLGFLRGSATSSAPRRRCASASRSWSAAGSPISASTRSSSAAWPRCSNGSVASAMPRPRTAARSPCTEGSRASSTRTASRALRLWKAAARARQRRRCARDPFRGRDRRRRDAAAERRALARGA